VPEIDITGSSPKGNNQIGDANFSNDAYRNAHLENASINASLNAQRRLAERVNSDIDTRSKTVRQIDERQYKDARTLAQFENAQLDMRIKKTKNADAAEYKDAYALARLENTNQDLRIRKQRAEDAREYREARGMAQYHNTNIDIQARKQKAADDRKYRDDYALAMRENRDIDIRNGRSSGGGGGGLFGTFARGYSSRPGIGAGFEGGMSALMSQIPLVGPIAEMITGALKDAFMAPQEVMGTLDNMYTSAKPLMDLRLAGGTIGRAGGFSNKGFADALLPGSGHPMDWMSAFGVRPEDVAPVLQSYGASRIGSTDQGMSVASDLFRMSQSDYLGNFSASQLGGMANQFQTLNGANPNASPFAGILDPQGEGNGTSGTADGYFRKLQSVMATAVGYGLDTSQVGNTMQSLMSNAASQGSANIDFNKLAGFWNQLTSSGDPNMRTGQGVLSMQQGINNNIDSQGYGGNVLTTQAFQYAVNQRKGGLKGLGSASAVANMFGIDTTTASPATMALLNQAATEAKTGSIVGFASAAAPLEKTSPQFDLNAAWGWAKASMPNASVTDQMQAAAKAAGVTYEQFSDWKSGSGQFAPSTGFKQMNPMTGQMGDITTAAANKAGVNPALLGSLFGVESGGRVDASKPNSMYQGLGQVSAATLAPAQKLGYVDSSISFGDLNKDPAKSAAASAGVLKMYLDKNGGDVTQALLGYGGWKDKNGHIGNLAGAQKYVGTIEANADPQGVDQVQQIVANLGQGDMNQSRGAEAALNSSLTGGNGDAILSFERSTTNFQASVGQFSGAIIQFIRGIGGTSGVVPPQAQHPFRMPPRTP
jgi:hypothetical protein